MLYWREQCVILDIEGVISLYDFYNFYAIEKFFANPTSHTLKAMCDSKANRVGLTYIDTLDRKFRLDKMVSKAEYTRDEKWDNHSDEERRRHYASKIKHSQAQYRAADFHHLEKDNDEAYPHIYFNDYATSTRILFETAEIIMVYKLNHPD